MTNDDTLRNRVADVEGRLGLLKDQALDLDLTRGKPSAEQLSLANGLDGILAGDYQAEDGTDARNYGCPEGLPEARRLGGELLGVPTDHVVVGGNSSLELMYHYVLWAKQFGPDGVDPWPADTTFLCPVPGYDRHFAICQELGIKMIPVSCTQDGPDMDKIGRAHV